MNYLYHYTRLNNIEKIIKNDHVDLIATYYQRFAADDYAWIKKNAEPIIQEICEDNHWRFDIDRLSYNPYVISFCKSANSMHMWKEFGDNGEGIALVFNQERLKEETSSFMNYACMVPCEYIYPNSERLQIKNTIIRIANSELLDVCTDDDKLIFAAMGVMQSKFYNEMEIRYVQIEERVFTASYNDGDVKIEEYNVPKEDWERHILFSKDIMEGVIFGKYVDSDDIISFKEYFSQCGFDHLFIKQAN